MNKKRTELIRATLEAQFSPVELLIKDQSHLHAGHKGAKDGKGHFSVTIISDIFEGKDKIQRHRMVYDALKQLLATQIHALQIKALTSAER
ncbi:MAG: BolA family transcriptional regulator [Woeseia sp.]|nr:BolA family transcriptional regulator [Woeseia sp.]|tara:strand:+ start:1307 stop:1579 length:273 start_codon:yes stop_codon:yes gene_type:complete